MDQATTPSTPLPRRVMGEVFWRFDGDPFASRAEFDAAIRAYQTRNWKKEWWRPEQVMIPTPRIQVRPDLSSFPSGEAPATVELTAEDGVAFTAGELLFRSHNAFVGVLRARDHRYFEGFRLVGAPQPAQLPVYEIQLGS